MNKRFWVSGEINSSIVVMPRVFGITVNFSLRSEIAFSVDLLKIVLPVLATKAKRISPFDGKAFCIKSSSSRYGSLSVSNALSEASKFVRRIPVANEQVIIIASTAKTNRLVTINSAIFFDKDDL